MKIGQYISDINKDDTGKHSSSQLWFHLMNAAFVVSYLYIIYYAARLPSIPLEGITFLTFVMSLLVTGNKLAGKFMNLKYGAAAPEVKDVK